MTVYFNKTKMGLSVPLSGGAKLVDPKGKIEIVPPDETTAGVLLLKNKGLLVPLRAETPAPPPAPAPAPATVPAPKKEIPKKEISTPTVAAPPPPPPPPPPVVEPTPPPPVVEEAPPPPVAEEAAPVPTQEPAPAETPPPTEPPQEPQWVGRRRRRG